MKLLPVLDLMNGQIVRGIAGDRADYRPIQSQIASDSRPVTVARALVDHYQCNELYLADLDAIGGANPAWPFYEQVADVGVRLIIDAGTGDPQRARQICQFAHRHSWVAGIVIGLESVSAPQFLRECCEMVGPKLAVFSLDLKLGQPLASVSAWQNESPLWIADQAVAAGFRRLIVLDLAFVGTAQGPTTTDLCRDLRAAYPAAEIISGGGVRSPTDLQRLLDAGCDRVLVASALHHGGWDKQA